MNTVSAGSARGRDYAPSGYGLTRQLAEEADGRASKQMSFLGESRSAAMTELVEVIGAAATVRLVQGFGGSRVYVPHTPVAGEVLVEQIGLSAAAKLAEIYGGERMEVPNPTSRRRQILELREQGVSVDLIARKLGCTRRRVFQVLAEARRGRRAAALSRKDEQGGELEG